MNDLVKQIKEKVQNSKQMKRTTKLEGNTETMISTGSTLLDLAISGGRVKGGGIPGGIIVEVFGPSSSGKTVLLCEIAGSVQRSGGEIMFRDPEARLNKQFAKIFDFDMSDHVDYEVINTVPELFRPVRKWEPAGDGINGIFADSLAALSTDLEMKDDVGDKMGMRRPKEFSEELRKSCRIITKKNFLMVLSNQVRENIDAGPYGQKHTSPGGLGIGFYCSLRLRFFGTEKIKREITIKSKKLKRVIGIQSQVEVFKSSIWEPSRIAPLTILFNYGIDDIRQNLQFVKNFTGSTVYAIGGKNLSKEMDAAIDIVEADGLIKKLRKETIVVWEKIEEKFQRPRKPKKR